MKNLNTKIFEIDKNNIDTNKIREAAALLKEGGLVAFPTETVYGLGGNALSESTVNKIFKAKGRPGDNPLIVHIYSFDQLENLALEIPKEAKILADKFWPGPLTMIFKAKSIIPENVTGGLNTVGVRMPSDMVALELLKETNLPIAAPSANISGRPSPTQGKHVIEDLNNKIDGIIVSSDSIIGIESTVLDVTVKPALILRPGSISIEEIRSIIPVEYEKTSQVSKPRSPGTKYRHYAPKSDLYIVKGSLEEKARKIKNVLEKSSDQRIGLLISQELMSELPPFNLSNIIVKIAGSISNPKEISSSLYRNLRDFDSENTQAIYMEDIPEEISGKAYQNRTEKASGGKIL
jgi:L-threonylcarbamoyladenylate synthase